MFADNNGDGSLPPLKKSKTSLALSQANMTEYRSSQDYIDDQLSPQTSPVLEPISPASPISLSSNAQLHRRLSPVDVTVPTVIPLLTRSSTLEEIKPTTPLSLPNESETAIENLSLGTRGSTVPGRGPGLERAMGVITTSRQGSPALGIVDMATRETTPMLMEEEIVQHLEVSQITTGSSDIRDVSSSIDTMDTVGHSYFHELYVELSDNSENGDADYELTADTTVDENFNRIDTSESEDDDSFSDIHIDNIASNNYDAESRGNSYTDLDPICLDRLTQEEKEMVMEEAREFDLLQNSKNIMVLTGAGVSVSCGIPDFRSPDGIYSRLAEFELEDPSQMFELEFFSEKPEVFYSFAKEIFPSNFTPSPSHNFIKLLEDQGKLLRNYTQNIDTLEQKAGIRNVLQCHGSFATASCIRCKHQVPGDDIKESILKQQVAYCKVCRAPSPTLQSQPDVLESIMKSAGEHDVSAAVMKPDIVFFGERLPSAFDGNFGEDRDKVDLLIVIGSSLKVAPVSDIMRKFIIIKSCKRYSQNDVSRAVLDQLPRNVPQILINRTPITHMEFDVQLLGNCDTIVAELCRMAGWELKHEQLPGGTSNIPSMNKNSNADGSGKDGRARWSLIEPNTYLFEGAILGDIEYELSQNSSKERGHFTHNDLGGYEADSDEDGGDLRRRSFGRAGRLSPPRPMDADCDSDDDSDESQGTIRCIQSSLFFDGTMESSLDETLELSPGFVVGARGSLSANIPEIHLSEASYSQESSLLDYSNMVNNRHSDYQEKGNDNSNDSVESTEKVPRDLEQSEQDDEFGSLHVDPQQIIDLESIVEDPQSENVSGSRL
ncbi:NAD-dependent histone deacetylase sir2 [Mortierella sp. AD010]|nr:NAD-dependent histone deacetylase sir2 [Mortierella sp. AD010]